MAMLIIETEKGKSAQKPCQAHYELHHVGHRSDRVLLGHCHRLIHGKINYADFYQNS